MPVIDFSFRGNYVDYAMHLKKTAPITLLGDKTSLVFFGAGSLVEIH